MLRRRGRAFGDARESLPRRGQTRAAQGAVGERDGASVAGVLAVARGERSGDEDNAARIDARYLHDGAFNGAEPAHVREALRAEKRGDVATARAMAKKVIDAWSVADMDVPAVAEMRKLVARLDRRTRDLVDHAK